jgi:hypothetical protein
MGCQINQAEMAIELVWILKPLPVLELIFLVSDIIQLIGLNFTAKSICLNVDCTVDSCFRRLFSEVKQTNALLLEAESLILLIPQPAAEHDAEPVLSTCCPQLFS